MVKKQTLDQKIGTASGFVRVSFPEEGFGEQSGKTFIMQLKKNPRNYNKEYVYLNGKSVRPGNPTYQFIKENSKAISYKL